MKTRAAVFLLLLVMNGCMSRQELAVTLVHDAGWQWQELATATFDLAAASAPGKRGSTLWVYLEGDGLAYLRPSEPSGDPSPRDPVALRLALTYPKDSPVAYLARPCQYTMAGHDRN